MDQDLSGGRNASDPFIASQGRRRPCLKGMFVLDYSKKLV
jgi:hypothetical protein